MNCCWIHAGGALLACPVTEPHVQEVDIVLPGVDEVDLLQLVLLHLSAEAVMRFLFQVWYDISSQEAYEGGRTLTLPVTLSTVSFCCD